MDLEINMGISETDRKAISTCLTKLLADSYLLYVKTQNFHWNVVGHQFVALHELFEKQYKELFDAIDDIAERIRSMGARAPGTLQEFIDLSSLNEAEVADVIPADKMVLELVHDNESIVRTARDIFPFVDNAKDESTADLITERMNTHEKNAWMLRSVVKSD